MDNLFLSSKVYDGTLGEVLYDHKNRGDTLKEVIYSISNNMMVEFEIPSSKIRAPNGLIHSWNVIDVEYSFYSFFL